MTHQLWKHGELIKIDPLWKAETRPLPPTLDIYIKSWVIVNVSSFRKRVFAKVIKSRILR